MSVEANKNLVTRYFEESNATKGDASKEAALVSAYLDPKAVFHLAAGDMSVERAGRFFAAFFKAFPDMGWTVEDMVAEGDKVVVRSTWKGTQTGEWMGAAPTRKKYTQPSMAIYRIAGGRIVEGWAVNDVRKEA
jgi:ketosteroid isomerase-like protein